MGNFKTLSGKEIGDLVLYLKEYYSKNEAIELIIGSDSQSYGSKKTIYGVVIVLYKKGKGGHVLCSRETKPKEYDLSTRLVTEVWKSIEVAELLKVNGFTIKYIDIDINGKPEYKSNKVLNQAVGMVEGMGYNVRHKNSGAMVTYSANHLVRI